MKSEATLVRVRMFFFLALWVFFALVGLGSGIAQSSPNISIHGEQWIVDIDPYTLAAKGRLANGATIPVSLGLPNLGQATNLTTKPDTASWDLPSCSLHITVNMEKDRFSFEIVSDKAQKFTWPLITPTTEMRSIILPYGEGFYVPVHVKVWQDFVTEDSPLDAMSELTMPLWGIDYGNRSLTYILTNPIDSSLSFEHNRDGLAMKVTHNFQANYREKKYGFMIMPGNASPIEPALLYRKWLIDTGQFVSLKDKLQKLPDLEKLFGAPHIYLWADGVMHADDVRKWPELFQDLRVSNSASAKRIVSLLPPDAREAIQTSKSEESPSRYDRSLILSGLNAVIANRELYQPGLWPMSSLPADLEGIAGDGSRSIADNAKLNSCLLSATFKTDLDDCRSFGGGISPKMIQHLQLAGFDRLLLLTSDLETLRLLPQTVSAAKQAGYLFGTYDSYHSIHPPGAKNTWETAQFDQKLYDTGRIINANGQPDRGFQGVGSHLSSIAAEPYLKKRVSEWMHQFGFNAYFIDCDATGELFDNYSTVYRATKQLDMKLRLDRLAWITTTFHVVLGSEMGDSFAAPVIAFGEGIMTPYFGGRDPLLHDKKSPYYLGRFYPAEQPEVFFKPTILPEKYKDIYYNPEYRIPLYQAAFHDSIVTTHHWSNPSLKFTNVLATNELLELEYGVPPLYDLNLDELEKREHELQTHYKFFSPNYRQLAFFPLSSFAWLTKDHLVQKVEFGAEASVIANFSDAAYTYQKHPVPPNSVLLIWEKTGKLAGYTSQYPPDTIP